MAAFNDHELLKQFLIQSNEHLTAIEPNLLLFEKLGAQTSQEVINRIFRAIHSIKGSASFFGFDTHKALSHSMESVFMLLRDNKLELMPEIIDVLFVGIVRLKWMLNDIENSDQIDCGELLTRLESLIKGETAPESNQKQTPPPQDDSLPAAAVESFNTAGRGVHFYQLPAKNYKLNEWHTLLEQVQPIGKAHRYEHKLQADSLQIREFCFNSVLEQGLAREALGMPEHDVTPFQPDRPNNAKSSPTAVLKGQDAGNQVTRKQLTPGPVPNGENIETIRVRIDLLNKLMDLAGEMALSKNQLIHTLGNHAVETQDLSAILQNVDLVTNELQEHIMQTRMQQIGSLFAKFPRLMHDIARHQEKEIEIQLEGERVEQGLIKEFELRQYISDHRQLDDAAFSEENAETHHFIHRGPQRRQAALQDLYIIILGFGSNQYGLIVDIVLNPEEIVVKLLSTHLKQCQYFSAATITAAACNIILKTEAELALIGKRQGRNDLHSVPDSVGFMVNDINEIIPVEDEDIEPLQPIRTKWKILPGWGRQAI